ncbi:MAG: putative double-glycine peptidase/putative small secreted protein [Verrucomicrobiales bacterium]|jgi:predicted double-glycine peptidase/predicted small secreted protein
MPAPSSPERRCKLTSATLVLLLTVACLSFTSCNTLRNGRDVIHVSSTSKKFAAAHDDDFKYCPLETIKQPSSKSCGIAALTSVMKYWEQDVDVEELEEKYPPRSNNGYPLLQLRSIATKEGLIAFALTMKDRPLDQISEQLENGRPVIVPALLPRGRYFGRDLPIVGRLNATTVNPNTQLVGGNFKHHYVVIFGESEDKFLIMDPAYGIVKISKSEFTNYWTAEKYAALLCSSF